MAAFDPKRKLSMDDLFQNPNDSMEVDPADLGPAFTDVLTHILAKRLAGQYEKPWTDKQEHVRYTTCNEL
jgi:hypothetical protein